MLRPIAGRAEMWHPFITLLSTKHGKTTLTVLFSGALCIAGLWCWNEQAGLKWKRRKLMSQRKDVWRS